MGVHNHGAADEIVFKAQDIGDEYFEESYSQLESNEEGSDTERSSQKAREFEDFMEADDMQRTELAEKIETQELEYFAGDLMSTALFVGKYQGDIQQSDPVSSEELLEYLSPPYHYIKLKTLLKYLCRLERRSSRYGSLTRSLFGLSIASNIYNDIPGATIAMSIIKQPLCDAYWIPKRLDEDGSTDDLLDTESNRSKNEPQEPLDPHVVSYAAKFACIAMMELGDWNGHPRGLQSVMAMSTANSIYVASQLLQDPFEHDESFCIRRIIGNVGQAGISMLVSPQGTRIRPLSDNWMLVQHKEFDGQAEDCFKTTSLHLSFTGHVLPVIFNPSGSIDSEVNLVETVVSVHDRGSWVADIDVMKTLVHQDFHRLRYPMDCHHSRNMGESRKTRGFQKLNSIENWDELFDEPENLRRGNLAVVRAHQNWLARLATACISVQKGYATVVLPNKGSLCQRCLADQFLLIHVCIM